MEMNLRNYAYIGDAVWELYVRKKTVLKTQNAKELHKMTTDKVKASYQSELLLKLIEEELTAAEISLVKRGRNLHIPVARRSNQAEYRQATAFEVLIGWWYLNDKDRLNYFLDKFGENL